MLKNPGNSQFRTIQVYPKDAAGHAGARCTRRPAAGTARMEREASTRKSDTQPASSVHVTDGDNNVLRL
jgi:hypothetical protein